MKKILLLLIALAVGLVAHAMLQTGISMQGMKRTVNGKTYYSFAIQTMWGGDQLPAQEGSSHTFSNATFAGVTLNGTLNFQEMSSFTDVVTASSFTVKIENNSLWFYGATVQTKSGTDVTGCSASVSNNKHTLTVTIPSGKTFATIIVDYVPNAPFSSSNTVISGLENSYLYLGSPIEPEPVVTYNGTVLTKDTDYTLSYWGSNRVGEAQLTVTGINEYAGDISKSYTIRKVALTDFNSLGNKTYEIATTTDLDYLALYITGGDDGSGITFKQTADIAYAHSSAWNTVNGENNFTAIGGYGNSFCGTYDGQNHTISGIRIYKNGNTNYDTSQGLFGFISSGAIVKKVILADARIIGYDNTGGIVGYNCGTIEDCRVESNVNILSVRQSSAVGGIAGISNGNNTTGVAISRCTFKGRVKHTAANSTNVGGIVGTLTNCPVSNCLVLGAYVDGNAYSGAIAGYKTSNSTLTANYYHDSEVSNTDNRSGAYINVGVGIGRGSEDQEGARSVHALTLPNGVTATGESVDVDGVTHYAAGTTVTLACSNVPEGYMAKYSVDGNTITGETFTMPAADATVTMQLIAIDYSITLPEQCDHGSVTCNQSTANYGETVTLTVTPDAGYALGSLTVLNGDTPVETTAGANGTYTFEMPAAPVTVAAVFVLPIDSINFPDVNFRDYLLDQDYGSDRVLTDEEIAGITEIFVNNMSIADLTGIEHFTALTTLQCNKNQLQTLDVSRNTALTTLQCNYNQLTALDLSQNTALTTLQCGENSLTALDLSQNTALTGLSCAPNQLTTLDVSHNAYLTRLQCSGNQLTALDVSHNTDLNRLYCSGNQLTALDVSHNTALTELFCGSNQLQMLDVSHNTALKWLFCNNNQLTALDVSHNTALTELQCDDNQINGENMAVLVASLPTVTGRSGTFRVINLDSETEQNVITTTQVATARGKNWEVLGLTNDNWTAYDGSADGLPIDSINFPDANFRNWLLSQSYGSDRVLTDEEIAGITEIDVYHKNIADLTGIEYFTALTVLQCQGNQLTALDVSGNNALEDLFCDNNQLTALDVSGNNALEYLYCNNNQLTALDVSQNTALVNLKCYNNQINGENMAALVASLPTVAVGNGVFYVIDLDSDTEQNVITTTQVATARGKNWTVYGRINGIWQEYDGIEPPIEVTYLDENRDEQSAMAVPLTGNEEYLGQYGKESWYFACGTLNYTQTLTLYGDVHLILADGAVMSIGSEAEPVSDYGIDGTAAECALTVYGQTLDDDTAGHLNIYSVNNCMLLWGYYSQYSGNVTLNSSIGRGLWLDYDVTFTGGTLNATADMEAITNGGNVDILGGKLSAVCVGSYWCINTIGDLTFGWKDADDEITISGHVNSGGTASIVAGQAFTDGENIYDSTTPSEVLLALTNVTLRPVVPGVPGDLNGDNTVDITDVNICINIILERNNDPAVKILADLSGDGTVDITDVNAIINIILTN